MMARKRSAWDQAERDLYLTSRTMKDVSAARRGPVVLGRRLARRSLTRTLFRMLRSAAR